MSSTKVFYSPWSDFVTWLLEPFPGGVLFLQYSLQEVNRASNVRHMENDTPHLIVRAPAYEPMCAIGLMTDRRPHLDQLTY